MSLGNSDLSTPGLGSKGFLVRLNYRSVAGEKGSGLREEIVVKIEVFSRSELIIRKLYVEKDCKDC